MRPLLYFVCAALLLLSACKTAKSPTDCAGVNYTTKTDNRSAAKAKRKANGGFFKRHKRTGKAEDGFKKEQKRQRSYGKMAEKGKKKEKTSKAERKWRLFHKKRADEKATDAESKRLFKSNPKKEAKTRKKKAKHPEMGLFPKKMRR